jgi:methionyl-tRNA synthetase
VLASAERSILDFERLMANKRFPQAFGVAEKYIRQANKTWSAGSKASQADPDAWPQALADSFHTLRVAATLMHPIVPHGCEKIRQQLGIDERMWSWDHIFEPLTFFMDDPKTHRPKELAPREDFFAPHPSQFRS